MDEFFLISIPDRRQKVMALILSVDFRRQSVNSSLDITKPPVDSKVETLATIVTKPPESRLFSTSVVSHQTSNFPPANTFLVSFSYYYKPILEV